MGCAGSSAVDKQLSLGRGESRERDYRSPNDDEPRKIEKIDNENITSCLAGLYQVDKILGEGAEGITYLVTDIKSEDQKKWAMKLIKLPLPIRLVQSIFREIKLQSDLGEGHLNIVAPEEVVLLSHHLGIVMEFVGGGSMTGLISDRFKECRGQGLLMKEDEALYFFRQIVNAIDYCHMNHVVHRDLKLDNTLLTSDSPPRIKICDFGFARGWGQDSNFTTVIGTPDYMSPQITAAKAQGKTLYDGTKADVWAMGVLLCVMLIGKFPFEGDSVSSMGVSDPMKKIWLQQNKCIWSDNAALKDQLEFLSKPALDLLGKMFELDEEKRIDVKGIKAHPWFSTPMRTEFQEAIEKMELSQTEVDNRAMIGAFRSKQRDAAISNLVKLSASDEFRKRAAEPINPDTVFQVWSRISLKTVLKSYPVFDKRSLRQMMSYTDGASTPSMRRDKTKKLAGTASVRG